MIDGIERKFLGLAYELTLGLHFRAPRVVPGGLGHQDRCRRACGTSSSEKCLCPAKRWRNALIQTPCLRFAMHADCYVLAGPLCTSGRWRACISCSIYRGCSPVLLVPMLRSSKARIIGSKRAEFAQITTLY